MCVVQIKLTRSSIRVCVCVCCVVQYADVVRLENYHFFVQTMSPRQQRLMGSTALLPYIDQAQVINKACLFLVPCNWSGPIIPLLNTNKRIIHSPTHDTTNYK